ncbi:DNA topoisomerase VI subunit B, partial [Candidatus Micrarchaeota archaeon]|nr:DNA topoisomerase VI subunit B [Candidatus Micrarchaeota archaeon]
MDIHKEFREYSVAEFFKKNRQMLGYSGKIKSLTTTVHEYVTNALDASEEAGLLPDIYVELRRMGPDYYKLIVEDNGPGINKKILAKAFGSMLTGTKFHRFQQARGQQGIGAAGVIMFSQVTTGKPTKVVSSQGDGKIYEVDLSIDVKSNTPNIENEKEYPGQMRGVRLESEFKDIKYQKGDYSVDEYLRRTALANPHAKITYIDPDNLTTVYDRAVDKLPKMPTSTLPHPKGLTVDDLMGYASVTKARNVKSFLQNDFSRMSAQKVKEIEDHVVFDMNKRPQDLKWEEAEQVTKEIEKMTFIAPPTDILIPIGEDSLEKALLNVIKPEFKTVITRPPTVYKGGVPFIIEVALAYGGKAGKPMEQEGRTTFEGEPAMQMEVMRFSNRVPLLFDAGGCAISKAVNAVEWKRYNIKEGEPVAVIVNFTSIYVPYTGAGKESISEDEDIIKEIRLALMDAARRLGTYVSGQRRAYEKERKKKILEMYAKSVADALASITGEDEKKVETKLR